MSIHSTAPNVTFSFNDVTGSVHKEKITVSFSIRFTHEERDYLVEQAGDKPIGTYICQYLL